MVARNVCGSVGRAILIGTALLSMGSGALANATEERIHVDSDNVKLVERQSDTFGSVLAALSGSSGSPSSGSSSLSNVMAGVDQLLGGSSSGSSGDLNSLINSLGGSSGINNLIGGASQADLNAAADALGVSADNLGDLISGFTSGSGGGNINDLLGNAGSTDFSGAAGAAGGALGGAAGAIGGALGGSGGPDIFGATDAVGGAVNGALSSSTGQAVQNGASNAANSAINGVTALAGVTTGGGGIEIWGGIAKGIRKLLKGGKFGVPAGLITPSGSFSISVLQKSYLATMVVAGLFIAFGVIAIPIWLLSCCCCLSRKKRNNIKKSFCKGFIAFLVVIIVSVAATIGFITGIRGNTLFDKALSDFQGSVDTTLKDTLDIVEVFPGLVKTSLATVLSGIDNVVTQTTGQVDANSVTSSVGSVSGQQGYAYDFDTALNTVVPPLQGLDSFVKNADSAVGNVDNAAQIASKLATVNTLVTNLNGVQSGAGASFQRVTPFNFDNNYATRVLAIADQLRAAQQYAQQNGGNIQGLFTDSGFSDIQAYLNDIQTIRGKLSDISGSITQALQQKTNQVGGVISTELKKFETSTQADADSSSESLVGTLKGAQDSIANLFKPTAPAGMAQKNLQKAFFFLFVVGVAVPGAVLLFIMLRWPGFLKSISPIVALGALVFLVFAALFLILTLVMGDFCQLADDMLFAKPEDSTLFDTSFAYLPKLFYYREETCLKQDLGLVRIGYQMGAFPENIANLTKGVEPTVEKFDLSEFWILGSSVGFDSISQSLSYFMTADNLLPWNAMLPNDINGLRPALNSLQSSVDGDVNDIKNQLGSTQPVSGINVISGSVTYESIVLTSYWSSLQTLQVTINDLSSDLNGFLGSFLPAINGYKAISEGQQAVLAQYPNIPNLYNSITSSLDDFSNTVTTQKLQPYNRDMKYNMLLAVDSARKNFEAGLPCKVLAQDTKVFTDSICIGTITATDSLWLSFAAIGLGLFIYVPCYGCLVNRLANGKRKGRGKVDPETGKAS
ncbi:hypothetical protein HDU97_000852 [Phlyctochytrium planicorne]|nr:hypothetical protein HDU97_000852 [Phlyctochytrium planicorne]